MRSNAHMALLCIAACLTLGGCGFQPLYGGGGHGGSDAPLLETFAKIDIGRGQDRLSQQVRNHLISALTPRGTASAVRYGLEFKIQEAFDGYAFRDDRAVTRQQLKMDADMVLIDLSTGVPVLEETVSSWIAYDVARSDFANAAAERDARDRAAAQLVDKMVARLAIFFRKGEGSGG